MTIRRKILISRMIDAGIPFSGLSIDMRPKFFSAVTEQQAAQAAAIIQAWVSEGGDNPLATKEDRLRVAVAEILSTDKFRAAQVLIVDELSGGPACPAAIKSFYRQEVEKLRKAWV